MFFEFKHENKLEKSKIEVELNDFQDSIKLFFGVCGPAWQFTLFT